MTENILLKDFLDSLSAEEGSSPNTISAYHTDLQQMIVFLGDDFANIQQKDIQTFIAYLYKEKYTATSICRKISAMKDFFKFLRERNKSERKNI